MTHSDHPEQPVNPIFKNRNRGEDIDLRHYLGLFLSNWYWFVASLFIAMTLAYTINKYAERVFTISATLLINYDKTGSDMTGVDKIVPGGNFFDNRQSLENEIGILKSFSLNRRVIDSLPEFLVTVNEIGRRGIAKRRLFRSEPFIIVFDSLEKQQPGVEIFMRILDSRTYSLRIKGTDLSRPAYRFGERFREAGFDFTVKLRDPDHYKYDPDNMCRFSFWFNTPDDLANEYRGSLAIAPLKEDATIVTLSMNGNEPLQEAEYLNMLMKVYKQQGLDFKNETATKTIDFIDSQLRNLSDSLRKAEYALEDFRKKSRFTDLSTEGKDIKDKLTAYSNEKISATLQKEYYEYLDDYVGTRNESGEIMAPSVMGVTDQMLVKLVDGLSSLQLEKKKIDYSIEGNQQLFNYINKGIDDARKAIRENIASSLVNINRIIADIDLRIAGVEKELDQLPATESRLIDIQRTYDLSNTVYTYMLEKKSEASISKESNVTGNRIIDYANPLNAEMIRPTGFKNLMFALALGLLIPGLYIYFVDRFHNTILDKKDIEAGTVVPVIGYVGHNSYDEDIPILSRSGTSLAESFRSIRTSLKYYMNGKDRAVISITSTISGEGKTFISVNLATALSLLGRKTLIIGMDLRKPKLDNIFGIGQDSGLSTYLIGETAYQDLVHETAIENLCYIPSGPVPPNPTELLETEKLKELMEIVRKHFDFIVIDTPPVGIVSDALLLGSYADINMFIIRQRFSFRSTLEYIQNIHNRKELDNLTIVVNDIHLSGYYGYGLRYGYGFYEGYGYNYGYGQYGAYGRSDSHNYYTNG